MDRPPFPAGASDQPAADGVLDPAPAAAPDETTIPPDPIRPDPVTNLAASSAHADWARWSGHQLTRLGPALDAAVRDARTRVVAIDDELTPVGDELVAYVATGGKRLRPLLVLLGHELAGATGDVLGPAVALELVHTWALIHDDVIDADDTRRGRPTTHRGFAARHREHGWAGSPDRYGEAMAMLVGDLVAAIADEAFERTTAPSALMVAGRRDFAALRLEVIAGQVLDVQVAATRTTDLDRALRVATLKSGRYTFTRPLQLGARLGGGDDDLMARLAATGDALGVAFQLRDDLLGVLGDPADTGKARGGDLREGKRTVLVAEAMARLDRDDATRLDAALGDPDLDDATIARLVDDLGDCGAIAAVRDRIDLLVATAHPLLDGLPAGGARDALASLATVLASRGA